MARTAKGWQLVRKPSGTYHVRFTHERRRYDISTREREASSATKAAAGIYADVVTGRLKKSASGALVKASTELAVIATDWIEDVASEFAPGAEAVHETYVRHWCAVMPTIGAVTTARIGDYQRSRLRQVKRVTLRKELSSLRRFLRWCVEKDVLRELPAFPEMPRKATGTAAAGARKKPTHVITEQEAEAILSAANQDPFLVACWETALRPVSTLSRLRREDLTPFGLVIRPECSKNRSSRTIPISDRARAALEAGLPFGRSTRRYLFKQAVLKALGRTDLTVYDLKHGRITKWVDEGKPLGGISYLADVSIKTLVSSYAHQSRRAAEEVLRCTIGAKEETVVDSAKKEASVSRRGVYGGTGSRPNTAGGTAEKAPDSATTSGEVVPLHQNPTPAEFRARSREWFRRAG